MTDAAAGIGKRGGNREQEALPPLSPLLRGRAAGGRASVGSRVGKDKKGPADFFLGLSLRPRSIESQHDTRRGESDVQGISWDLHDLNDECCKTEMRRDERLRIRGRWRRRDNPLLRGVIRHLLYRAWESERGIECEEGMSGGRREGGSRRGQTCKT